MLASITMDPEQWKSAACQIAAPKLTTHELTNEEWNHFLPGIPYSPACQTAGLARPVVSHPE